MVTLMKIMWLRAGVSGVFRNLGFIGYISRVMSELITNDEYITMLPFLSGLTAGEKKLIMTFATITRALNQNGYTEFYIELREGKDKVVKAIAMKMIPQNGSRQEDIARATFYILCLTEKEPIQKIDAEELEAFKDTILESLKHIKN